MNTADKLKALKARSNVKDKKRRKPSAKTLHIRKAVMFSLTVGEMRAAVEANPDHPVAKVWACNLHYPDDKEFHVEKMDLDALLDDRDIDTDMAPGSDETGPLRVRTKKLGGPRQRKEGEAPREAKPAEAKPIPPVPPTTKPAESK